MKAQTLPREEIAEDFLSVISENGTGGYQVSLPPALSIYTEELERLLVKVFAGRPLRAENLELARQMSINWCLSKCREAGIKLEEEWLPPAGG